MERFDTSVRYHAWYEHWHRYHFVLELVKNKKVCDAACGVGYGSALMASVANSVTGIDLNKKTIDAATKEYSSISNLNYKHSNAINLDCEDNSYDVLVSFETLEHLYEHDELLTEFQRVLKTDGLLIISTPDKDVYSANDDHNHFHVKELTSLEFDGLIDSKFKYNKTYGQQFQLLSVIEKLQIEENHSDYKSVYVKQGKENLSIKNESKPQYLIKLCSNNKQTINNIEMPNIHTFADSTNSLYHHYEEQVIRLLQIDKQNKLLIETVEKQNTLIDHLKARLGF